MHEFQFIQQYLAPLSKDGLCNDGATISIPSGKQLVVTTDTLIAGRHFIGDETPAQIAQKALRVNLSDIAAMGAAPLAYSMALSFDTPPTQAWAKSFASGLETDQALFNLYLLGGDTTLSNNKLSITISMLATINKSDELKRNTAKAGDLLYHSGVLGLGAKGLKDRQLGLQTQASAHYLKPQPRVQLGQQLVNIASSCLDISDGLAQDAEHIAQQSKVQLVIETEAVNGDWRNTGDDYELLFTVPPEKEYLLQQLSDKTKLTKIGYAKAQENNGFPVVFLNNNQPVSLPQGFKHF